MMFKDEETEFGEISKQGEILDRAGSRPTCGRRWAKRLDAAEKSLYWLIPAVTLAYAVFRILPLLGS
jgi:hypothetical protein